MVIGFKAKSKQATMITFEPSREYPLTRSCQARETSRVRETLKANNYLWEWVCKVFNARHFVSCNTCKNMVRVLYLNLDLSHLPPSKKNLDEFLVKICEEGSYKFSDFIIPCYMSCGVKIYEWIL